MLDELFTFPTVMVDGENEDEKMKKAGLLNRDTPDPVDLIYGESEFPYYDFVGIADKWLPTPESLERALNGKFDACIVIFSNVGPLLVPWTRAKFKRELRKFIGTLPKPDPKMKMYHINTEQLEKILEESKEIEDEDKEGEEGE